MRALLRLSNPKIGVGTRLYHREQPEYYYIIEEPLITMEGIYYCEVSRYRTEDGIFVRRYNPERLGKFYLERDGKSIAELGIL